MHNTPKNRILIVDDDAGIRDLLAEFLGLHDFKTYLAPDGKVMRTVLAEQEIDLIILDIMLPGEDGLSLCRQLRKTSCIPILMLTAAGEEVDRIVGLEMGADDYLQKPFHPRELLARIKAILRRVQNPLQEKTLLKNPVYHFVNWTLDTGTRRLISPDQLDVSITTAEYNLLLALLERPQQVQTRDELLIATKNRSAGPFDRGVDIQISRLRQKIEEDMKNPTVLKTVRGDGYLLAVPVTVTYHE
ncbi:MAG: hypothetical protein ACD_70C00114G0003 [uncultured bacterium]|nr:MAG: hypothetical protein ACD_70C00114G0003 [uncultured bacterium]OGT25538.1 MAG: DNA-binding response regulator [Gammaproteobacteria bacterium RIFCSPHIGHO2_02_FULL_42_43]OGT28451.1 MAG: DNA-binding response regulator [Gammaproteobacteria bacterium RIFCSPHIGHO2_01_FULL_42_8]OGT51492.1 MAG: DNA-binding response regulator [Gammaproteobacteria bacterium RIFCSPHIGHO2_12_FULL_41_25]OGT62193.1 MAG: DNA-binding response regulator [Gammaproteobacteria bacterium RIFCSPLOWO2_02_FULL_42_14]OGT85866.1 